MLNKELLMTVGEGSEPVLSIYISPGNPANVAVSVRLSSGNVIHLTTQNTERKTFKFSEIDVNSSIGVRYDQDSASLAIKNLGYSPINPHAAEIWFVDLWIEDVTKSASIEIKE